MHLRAVSGLPCPAPKLLVNYTMMVNVIGKGTTEDTLGIISKAYSLSGAGIHWYGKSDSRLGRKMAHITLTANTLSELVASADQLGVER